jgi:hypothetical protein
MSNVPRAREVIAEVVADLRAAGYRELAGRLDAVLADLHRRPLVRRRAPIESRPVDASMAAALRRYAHRHPKLSQQAIAERFGVNHGRVAEALRGDR